MIDTPYLYESNLKAPVHLIRVNPLNPRRNAEADDALVASVRQLGIIEPLVLRMVVDGDEDSFELLAGHRRLDAAIKAGFNRVPAVIRQVDDAGALEVMLVENLARQDLQPLEEAEGIRQLTGLGRTQRQVAELLGVSQSHVSKRLALLKLPEAARKAVDSGGMHIELALELTKLPEKEQAKLFKKGVPNEWQIKDEVRRHETAEKKAKLVAEFEAAGVTILGNRPSWNANRDKPPCSLPMIGVRAEDHQSEPCRAVYINGTFVEECCTDPARHPAVEDVDDEPDEAFVPGKGWTLVSELTDEEKAVFEEKRRKDAEQESRRAAREAARARRCEFTKQLISRPCVNDVVALAAHTLPRLGEIQLGGVLELLGVEPGDWDEQPQQTEAFAGDDIRTQTQVLYALALEAGESTMPNSNGWHDEDFEQVTRRYLRHLAAKGYELDEIEAELAAQQQTLDVEPVDDLDDTPLGLATDREEQRLPLDVVLEQLDEAQGTAEADHDQGFEDPPKVTIARKGKRWNITCAECGPVGFNTSEAMAEQRRTGHLADKHPSER
jgi:ParB/RepB/Spo0J family partition protein